MHAFACRDNLSRTGSNAELLTNLDDISEYYDRCYALAENIRYAHEYGSMSFDTAPTSTVQSSKKLFQSKLAGNGSVVRDKNAEGHVLIPTEASHDDTDSRETAKDLFELRYKIIYI